MPSRYMTEDDLRRLRRRKKREEEANQGFLSNVGNFFSKAWGGAQDTAAAASDTAQNMLGMIGGNPFEYGPQAFISADDYQRSLRGR